MKKLIIVWMFVLVLMLGMSEIHSLGDKASITGTVLLDDGSTIPGVTVILTGEPIKPMAKMTTVTSALGQFRFLNLPPGAYNLKYELEGFKTTIHKDIRLKAGQTFRTQMVMHVANLEESIVVSGKAPTVDRRKTQGVASLDVEKLSMIPTRNRSFMDYVNTVPGSFNTEEYHRIYENRFKDTVNNPLSTFSIDVDTASYANTRRFIKGNGLPPKDAVRAEELINYFTYDYPQPESDVPFSITSEVSRCPWNQGHLLMHLGLQGKRIKSEDRMASNLVFLLDVSGSMGTPNKLPLLQAAFKMLVKQLSPDDRVSIVVYAGAAGLVLPPTTGNRKETIDNAIDRLRAGGSTAGGQGIRLAYDMAEKHFIKDGNNRVILATDGDFNIGVSSTSELVRLIEEKREKGVFLTLLGFGMGNYKDSRMEQLADKGNGNYFYIDGLLEAKKVLVDELGGTLFTIAKDVKIQVEFNPAKVKAYKLVGYENRLLANEDFNDDTKDAGELGAGHSVTVLYEIIPANSGEKVPGVDFLKYQRRKILARARKAKELMTVKLRYKEPEGKKSKRIETPVPDQVKAVKKTTDNYRFSAAVAQWALLLRDSKFKGNASYDSVLELAKGARGEDENGYRSEFLQLVELSRLIRKNHGN
ncbi:MAG: DUF3520 domain-containing protein [bacterium]|nr:DUF3520 domain-containing protein [bacterium]